MGGTLRWAARRAASGPRVLAAAGHLRLHLRMRMPRCQRAMRRSRLGPMTAACHSRSPLLEQSRPCRPVLCTNTAWRTTRAERAARLPEFDKKLLKIIASPAAVDEYVAKAARLAADPASLAALRRGLRQRMLQVRARRQAGTLLPADGTFQAGWSAVCLTWSRLHWPGLPRVSTRMGGGREGLGGALAGALPAASCSFSRVAGRGSVPQVPPQ